MKNIENALVILAGGNGSRFGKKLPKQFTQINGENLIFKTLNYNLSFFEKVKIIYLLFTTKISDIYILTPKQFYYYLQKTK